MAKNAHSIPLKPHSFYVGLCSGAFFLVMALLSALLPWLESEKPIGETLGPAILFSGFWLIMSLLAAYLIATYWRHELLFGDEKICFQGGILRKEIRRDDVAEIAWKYKHRRFQVEIISEETTLTIELTNYTDVAQKHIIAFLRERFLPEYHTDWVEFEAKRNESKTPQKTLSAALMCAFVWFIAAGLFAFAAFIGAGWGWLLVNVGCTLAGVWYLYRAWYWRDEIPVEAMER